MEKRQQGGASKLVILLLLLILVMTLVGAAAGLYLADVFDRGDDVAGETTEGESTQTGPPIYHKLDTITVNLSTGDNPRARARMLQAQVQVMTRHEEALEGLDAHLPRVRNNLILLFGNQKYEDLIAREGKEALRAQALDEINAVLAENDVLSEFEAVYFTDLVMQ